MLATFDSSLRIWPEREGDQVWVRFQNLTSGRAGREQGDLYTLMLLMNLVRRIAGPAWTPSEIHLQMRGNRELADMAALSAVRLRFEQPACGIALPGALLSRPFPAPANGHAAPHASARDGLEASAPALDLSGSLGQLLRVQIREGRTGIQRIAEAAGIHEHTLKRRLKEQGLQYSRLLEKTRFALAIELLEDPGLKVIDIAHELGYGNSANFTRAFQRWTGVAPREFRRRPYAGKP